MFAPRPLSVAERQRYFQEHEGIAVGGGDDPLQYLWCQRTRRLVREEGCRSLRVKALEPQFGELRRNSVGVLVVFADGEEHGYPLRLQAPGCEGDRGQTRRIEPLRILDDAEQRSCFGCSRH